MYKTLIRFDIWNDCSNLSCTYLIIFWKNENLNVLKRVVTRIDLYCYTIVHNVLVSMFIQKFIALELCKQK